MLRVAHLHVHRRGNPLLGNIDTRARRSNGLVGGDGEGDDDQAAPVGMRLLAPTGWINSDRKEGPGIDISCDIRDGLPLDAGSVDYAVSIHALPEVPYPDLVPVLKELRRVLRPNGVLRLGLPDVDRTIQAYLRKDRSYFPIPDEEA